ncbi:DUF7282 domain-containing protein [Halococcus thailandensis]|uniref:DUF7282 domain-containing protein n=1 Tax=Halococcus thailandensis JCM 13552 TaxID=1227457 RepID=M0NBK5_9EURY|nr:hypothetical protein [Halococcus thailandensis]EMA55357.1 hypothetical protein C451_05323 [Halococcus thailandensis JCM 13552]
MRPAAATLFGGSVFVVVVVGIILGGLAPIETAAGQTQTQTQTQNQSNASVEFVNQTTNGSDVTVESVTLPTSGFVVIDLSGAGVEGLLEEDAVAVSEQLSAGTHQNVTIPINQSPPGGVANRTSLNNTGNYEAIVYEDSNDNGRFDYLTSGTSLDKPLIVGSGAQERLVSDNARLTIRGSRGDPNATPTPSASIQFSDQQTDGSTVSVASVTLPQGGFVVVHSEQYLQPQNDPVTSAVGLSAYLSAGTHQNVTVALMNGSVQQPQTLVAIPSRDTNQNQTYDYVTSGGFQDVPYTDGEAITDQASVSRLEATTAVSTSNQSPSPSTTSTAAIERTDTTTDTNQTEQAADSDGNGGSGLSGVAWIVGIVLVIVIVGGGYLLIKLR